MNGLDWRPYAHLLGTDLDTVIARRVSEMTGLTITRNAVYCARAQRGIPAFLPYTRWFKSGLWLRFEELTQRELGELAGVTAEAAGAARRRAGGVGPYCQRAKKGIAWGAVDWSRTDAEIAREVGCTRNRVRTARREAESRRKS